MTARYAHNFVPYVRRLCCMLTEVSNTCGLLDDYSYVTGCKCWMAELGVIVKSNTEISAPLSASQQNYVRKCSGVPNRNYVKLRAAVKLLGNYLYPIGHKGVIPTSAGG